MKATAQSIPTLAPGIEASRFGADYVVLDQAGRTLRGLNPTAARVWELIDGHRPAEQIAGKIAVEFKSSAEKVLADVLSFLEVLRDRDLVQLQAGAERGIETGALE